MACWHLLPLLLLSSALAAQPPLFHGCLDNVSQALPYCNTSLSFEVRVEDVISRLSTDEKITLLTPTTEHFCAVDTRPIPHIGMPPYKWLTEVNTDVDGGCVKKQCPTIFIGPLGMAASFNRSSWYAKGDVISTEMRATNNAGLGKNGLTGFGPNINMLKDPRFGRNSELPGEDPFLSGSYAVSYLHGMQQPSAQSRPKMLAYVKHYTAYNVETNRFTFKANVSQFDFWDSYLPHYEMAFTEGNASGAMCSYFAANGVSSCGDPWLLNEVVRKFWGRPDAVFESDCAAVVNMVRNHYAKSPEDASAKALNAGMDVYGGWGDNLWGPKPYGQGLLHKAIDDGLTSEALLNAAVRRTLMQKMKVGLFDPLEGQPWTQIPTDVIGSEPHIQVSYEAALQGIVLLKNSGGALPFPAATKLAVVGPFADEGIGLFSDYAEPHPPYDTFQKAFGRVNRGTTKFAAGIDVDSQKASGIGAALDLVKESDVVVLALGITKKQEHEGIDRKDTKLPGLQASFAQSVFDAAGNKTVVLVLVNGGVLIVDELVPRSAAVVEAFNPCHQGPQALADLLFGLQNRWGKLPVTIYDDHKMLPLQDMSFATPPGRSYRYYQGKPTFPFGHGLSYTTFSHHCQLSSEGEGDLEVSCVLENTGSREGDEVIMAFHSVSQEIRDQVDHPVPIKRLVGFERVSLAAGHNQAVTIKIARQRLSLTNKDGDYMLYPGRHTLTLTRGHGDEQHLDVQVQKSAIRHNSHPQREDAAQVVVV